MPYYVCNSLLQILRSRKDSMTIPEFVLSLHRDKTVDVSNVGERKNFCFILCFSLPYFIVIQTYQEREKSVRTYISA